MPAPNISHVRPWIWARYVVQAVASPFAIDMDVLTLDVVLIVWYICFVKGKRTASVEVNDVVDMVIGMAVAPGGGALPDNFVLAGVLAKNLV